MTLLSHKERKTLVKEICTRFHSDGLSRLEIVGHFQKYTPLYHFRIAEPIYEDFIFITDLFGDVNNKPGLMPRGTRMQYHGNYDGLSKIITQGINDAMIAPSKHGEILTRPSFRLECEKNTIPQESRQNFDNALRYIDHVLRLTIPDTKRLDVNTETFSSTYYVI